MIKTIVKRKRSLESKSIPLTFKKITENKTVKQNNNNKNEDNMNKNDLSKADSIVSSINKDSNVKKIKSEKGLIERIETNKIVLTEDNKMLLKD